MSKPAAIDAQVVDICNDRQHKGSIKITLHVPSEAGALLTEILGWPTYTTPVPVAIARLKQQQEEPTTATEKPAPSNPAARVPRNRLTTKIAMLCNDSLFRQWLQVNCNLPVATKEDAAALVRHNCGVESRSDIIAGTVPGNRWDIMESAFICWRDRDAFVEQPA